MIRLEKGEESMGVLRDSERAVDTESEAERETEDARERESKRERERESCLLYTSPSPRDGLLSRMPSSA